jgi:isocitrate dehydrogenase (NAD+)
VHGSAPDIAGQNVANPLALIRSAIMMLRHLEMFEVVERLRAALRNVIVERGIRTRDLGGTATTTEFTEHVVRAIER